MMTSRLRRGGFTILELAVSLALIVVLLAILLPALSSARMASRRDRCAGNQRQIGGAWFGYLEDHRDRFPFVHVQAAWRYGGVRFSSADERPFLDYQRPLTPYVPAGSGEMAVELLFHCPSDRGIAGGLREAGTAGRSAYRSFGTSYRANAAVLDSRLANLPEERMPEVRRGLYRSEITTPPSRMVIMGDAFWYEVRERTGREADWHEEENSGNLLFLDGSVRFMTISPRPVVGPAVFEPVIAGTAWRLRDEGDETGGEAAEEE